MAVHSPLQQDGIEGGGVILYKIGEKSRGYAKEGASGVGSMVSNGVAKQDRQYYIVTRRKRSQLLQLYGSWYNSL